MEITSPKKLGFLENYTSEIVTIDSIILTRKTNFKRVLDYFFIQITEREI